jgi:hypothetical protein
MKAASGFTELATLWAHPDMTSHVVVDPATFEEWYRSQISSDTVEAGTY